MKKNLTLKYSINQALYFAIYACVFSYAATYLQDMGFKASQVGVILFCANFLSFSLQPFLGALIDSAKKNILPEVQGILAIVSALFFALIQVIKPGLFIFALLYVSGLTLYDMDIALLNSINVFYTDHNYGINYGAGRAAGGIGYAIVSLGLGYVISFLGSQWTVFIAVIILVLMAFVGWSYPREEKINDKEKEKQATKLGVFFGKYSWYTFSLLGVILLGLVHSMIENYLIEIIRPLGGDSSNVGIALSIATFTEIPALFFISFIVKKLGTKRCLIISGISFTLKAVLFLFAGSLGLIYIGQLSQMTNYVLLSPVQMYFAKECIPSNDMAKGQSLSTASYALGCAAGNLLGGVLITAFGIKGMLATAIACGLFGTVVFIVTVPRALTSGK